MCGIVAVMVRPQDEAPADVQALVAVAGSVAAQLAGLEAPLDDVAVLEGAAEQARSLNRQLRRQSVVVGLLRQPSAAELLRGEAAQIAASIARLQTSLTDQASTAAAQSDASQAAQTVTSQLDRAGTALGTLADASFELTKDRLGTYDDITSLAGASLAEPGGLAPSAVATWWAIAVALAGIDRLEVRGRDSAGISVFVGAEGTTLERLTGEVERLDRRSELFVSGDVNVGATGATFVYKTAAEIGELGDNTAVLRKQISSDRLLHEVVVACGAASGSERASGAHLLGCPPTVVLGHTRWASVGIISEPNAHPLDGQTGHAQNGQAAAQLEAQPAAPANPHVTAVVNGDVDNHRELISGAEIQLPPAITTDAKVVPTLLAEAVAANSGFDAPDLRADLSALARQLAPTFASFDGSVAIAAHSSSHPETIALALRGSGQAMYLGATDSGWLAASEPYGLVAECDQYVRLDGETPADAANPVGSRGQLVLVPVPDESRTEPRLDQPTREALVRVGYSGQSLPYAAADVVEADVTTRDIDRGDARHFFVKEIREAPRSFRATVAGRVARDSSGAPIGTTLGAALPPHLTERLRSGRITRVIAIGQGTAAAAAESLCQFVDYLAADVAPEPTATDSTRAEAKPVVYRLSASAHLATELSGFGLRTDMSDTLVVAVSQSGTTTDTNRTVELARARDAAVVAIVNRRSSDLTHRADGVLYTSDGRDVEMSVASTKAYYSQVAACALLAVALNEAVAGTPDTTGTEPHGITSSNRARALLAGLAAIPAAMEQVLTTAPHIAHIARQHIGAKRHWAVVGNGWNQLAAREVRIKLSELCYHSVALDATENKKHIDLSSEPLIVVCAAGLTTSVRQDVEKEVAIYRAHRATPIVITTQPAGELADVAAAVIEVPPVHPTLDFVLATMAGHLLAYEAALAIDSLASPLREARAALEALLASQRLAAAAPTVDAQQGEQATDDLLADVAEAVVEPLSAALGPLNAGDYDGHLRATTALRLATAARYATGVTPLDSFQTETGTLGTPAAVVEHLAAALNTAIDELGRPIDAIRHQAKSVTVGISRAEETLLNSVLVGASLDAGAPREHLSYGAMQSLASLDQAVEAVTGFTRYRVDGAVGADDTTATIAVLNQGGVAAGITSRTATDATLRGTKHRAAFEREVTVGVGRDGRSVVVVPETAGGATVGITLLHCDFRPRLAADAAKAVLRGYRGRYGALRDAVTELLPSFDDAVLANVAPIELLTKPVHVLAGTWVAADSGAAS